QCYQQTQEVLVRLRKDAQQRDALRQRRAKRENDRTKLEATIQHVQERLNEVEEAYRQISMLAPLVEQQMECEKQRDETKHRVMRYEQLIAEMNGMQKKQDKYQQEQTKLQGRIALVEPLVPLAELLHERNEAFTQLRIQLSERNNKSRQLQEKREALR